VNESLVLYQMTPTARALALCSRTVLGKLAAEQQAVQEQCGALEAELREQIGASEASHEAAEKLAEELRTQRSKNARMRARNARLEEKATTVQEALEDERRRLRGMDRDLNLERERTSLLESRIKHLELELDRRNLAISNAEIEATNRCEVETRALRVRYDARLQEMGMELAQSRRLAAFPVENRARREGRATSHDGKKAEEEEEAAAAALAQEEKVTREISKLEERVEVHRVATNEATLRAGVAETRLEAAQADAAAANTRAETAVAEAAALRERVVRAEAAASEAASDATRTREELSSLRRATEAELAAVEERTADARRGCEAAERRVAEMEDALAEAREEVRAKHSQIVAHAEEVQRLEGQAKATDAEMVRLREELSRAAEAARAQIDAEAGLRSALGRSRSSLERSLWSLRADTASLRSSMAGTVESFRREVAMLAEDSAASFQSLKALADAALGHERDRRVQTERALSETKASLDQARESAANAEAAASARASELERSLSEANVQAEKLKARHEEEMLTTVAEKDRCMNESLSSVRAAADADARKAQAEATELRGALERATLGSTQMLTALAELGPSLDVDGLAGWLLCDDPPRRGEAVTVVQSATLAWAEAREQAVRAEQQRLSAELLERASRSADAMLEDERAWRERATSAAEEENAKTRANADAEVAALKAEKARAEASLREWQNEHNDALAQLRAAAEEHSRRMLRELASTMEEVEELRELHIRELRQRQSAKSPLPVR